ncbi:LEAF RUST 10 DISEASE-RESISTANCE LOCUS RECEPTOR-LIKE PROTEIN KINASE-like 2.5, partial [Dichanthelium oligosanthes]
LHGCKGNGEEFVNEVMSIGRTSHVNIVNLYGFCLERSKRALIYEYMPNGSLDRYIYCENPKEILGWQKLYTIAIGIARGLEYLHHSCNESKLSVTGARGTIGFIAPEVHSRTFGVVSTKSDVYSYGMMLLEMVGGRNDGLQACEVTSEVEEIARKMTLIGFWCIQVLPMHRPTITNVLEMFERGLDDLDMPPKQNFSQIQ